MAIQTSDVYRNGTRTVRYTENFGSVQSGETTSQQFESALTQTRNTVRTPGFHSPSRPAILLPNAFSFVKEELVNWAGVYTSVPANPYAKPSDYGYYNYRAVGPGAGGPQYTSSLYGQSTIDLLSDQAKNALLSKIKRQSINVAQAFAERKQTANTIASTATAIAGCLLALKRGNFKAAARSLGVATRKRGESRFKRALRQGDHVATGWLQLQYGWRPLINDVFGAAEFLAKHHNSPIYFKDKARKKILFDSDPVVRTVDGEYITWHRRRVVSRCEVTYGVTYFIREPQSSIPAQLGLTNPAVIAWELMPWSFVIDWFLPIGQFLGSLDATRGLEFHSGYKTVFNTTRCISSLTAHGKASGQILFKNQSAYHNLVSVTRTPLSAFPSPGLPRFKNPVSLEHLANGLALLIKLRK